MKGKEGNMPMWKLVSIIILIVVLVTLVYGIANGMVPSIERIGGIADGVMNSLQFWKSGSNENCYVDSVSSYPDGKKFFLDMGMVESDSIKVGRCQGVCNLTGGGLASHRVSGGVFERLENGVWGKWNNFFVGSLGNVKNNWERYHAGIEFLDGQVASHDFLLGIESSKQFVLFGDGEGGVLAIWQNNEWIVVKGAKGAKVAERVDINGRKYDGFGREILYKGVDDGGALDVFYDEVDDLIFDDNVYWKILNKGEVYDENVDKGEVIGLVARKNISIEELYAGIVMAEHSLPVDADLIGPSVLWIRTEVKGSGSTAYGPVQLTMGLVKGYLEDGKITWSSEEKEYLNRFVEQGCLFLLHGGGKIDLNQLESFGCKSVYEKLGVNKNTKYNVEYDYSGSGGLVSGEDKVMYKQIVQKMLNEIYVRNGYDLDSVWREWRFGLGDMNKYKCSEGTSDGDNCFGYKTRFYSVLGGTNLHLNSKTKLEDLKANFLKLKTGALADLGLSLSQMEELREDIRAKSIFVSEVEFKVDTVATGSGVVITFDSGSEKFGLRYFPHGKVNSNFLFNGQSVLLDSRPFVLVGDKGNDWSLVGSEGYYKLKKNEFDSIYKSSVINEFLRSICR